MSGAEPDLTPARLWDCPPKEGVESGAIGGLLRGSGIGHGNSVVILPVPEIDESDLVGEPDPHVATLVVLA